MNEYVTFQIGGRTFATRIGEVREVVRLSELVGLPGMEPPLAGLLELRGTSLPVIDIRPVPGAAGDVLVLNDGDGEVGFACDAVVAVVDGDSLPPEDSRARDALPSYVEAVLRGATGAVFLVDIRGMAGDRASALVSLARAV